MEGVILIALLVVLAWQDFKSRTVSVYLLAAVGAYGLAFMLLGKGNLHFLGFNLSLLAIVCLALLLYYKLRYGFKTKVINHKLGLGDLLLLTVLTPFFSPINYVVFINVACALALAFELSKKKRTEHIPLISYFTLSYILGLLVQAAWHFPSYHFQHDWIWF